MIVANARRDAEIAARRRATPRRRASTPRPTGDPEFYAFVRSLEAYRKTIDGDDARGVARHEFFQYLEGARRELDGCASVSRSPAARSAHAPNAANSAEHSATARARSPRRRPAASWRSSGARSRRRAARCPAAPRPRGSAALDANAERLPSTANSEHRERLHQARVESDRQRVVSRPSLLRAGCTRAARTSESERGSASSSARSSALPSSKPRRLARSRARRGLEVVARELAEARVLEAPALVGLDCALSAWTLRTSRPLASRS